MNVFALILTVAYATDIAEGAAASDASPARACCAVAGGLAGLVGLAGHTDLPVVVAVGLAVAPALLRLLAEGTGPVSWPRMMWVLAVLELDCALILASG